MNDQGTFDAGWYPDPEGSHDYRYYDGDQWTDEVADAGAVSEAPLASPPPPPPSPSRGESAESTLGTDKTTDSDTSATSSRRKWWVLGGVVAAAVAAVAVVVVLALGDGDAPAEPRIGTYSGGGDDVTISLVVAGDPPALTNLEIETTCGSLTRSESIELLSPLPIEAGSFELFLPPPGQMELEGTFVDDGERVRGDVATGSCSGAWEATFVGEAAAAPGTGDEEVVAAGIGSPPTANAVSWAAPDATLTAANFYIEANGLVFTADADDVEVHGNPLSGGVYTTIEVTWTEHEREMRFYLYLDSFPGNTWGTDEFRVYDGTTDPDWVYFEDRYVEVPIGQAFLADSFEAVGAGDVIVHFDGLVIDSNLEPLDDGGDDETATVEPEPEPEPETETVEPEPEPTAVITPEEGASEDGPDADVTGSQFLDAFVGALDEGWTWLNEDPTHWNLDERPGWLAILAQVAGPDGNWNTLVRPMPQDPDPDATYFFETTVAFEPTSNFQFAGLTIAGGDPDRNRVQFGRSYCDDVVCVGDGVYFDYVEDGAFVGENNAVALQDDGELRLRLVANQQDSGLWLIGAAFASGDGDWNVVGFHLVDFDLDYVGLIAGQAPTEITASFDYFGFRTEGSG